MIMFGYAVLNAFKQQHPDAQSSINTWFTIASNAGWKDIIEIKQTYPHADAVGACTVFNVKGNHYRLIAKIDYRAQIISIKRVLTHAEYDKEKWKKDCGF